MFVTETIARMYGANPDGTSQLEGATRRALKWTLKSASALIKMAPVFSPNFRFPVSKSLDDVVTLIKE